MGAETPNSNKLTRATAAAKASLSQFFEKKTKPIKVGHRFLLVHLLDDTKGQPNDGSFIGSINRLEADQQYLLLRPYVETVFNHEPFTWGAGLSYDYLDIATRDNGTGDGDIQMKAIIAYLKAAYPNTTRFTPFGEIGIALFFNDFDPEPSWSQNGLRTFDLDDSGTLHLAGGVDYAFRNNIEFNFYVRYTDVDVNGVYIFRGDPRDPTSFTFTLEHLAYGLGLTYVF